MARKRKYQKGMETDKPMPREQLKEYMAMDDFAPRRDSIFVDRQYITTDPVTGLPKKGKDPLTPEERLKQMAIKNRRKDVEWEMMKERNRADKMVDEIIMDDWDESEPVQEPWDEAETVDPGMPEPKESDWKIMMKKRRKDTIKKSPSPGIPWDDIPYGTKNPKSGPGYGRGGMLKRGGSVKSGSKGRNGVL